MGCAALVIGRPVFVLSFSFHDPMKSRKARTYVYGPLTSLGSKLSCRAN